MKNINYSIFLVPLVIFLNSCAPVYKCGQSKPFKTPITWSKNMKAVISERDRLCANLAAEEKENTELKITIAELKTRLAELSVQYDTLMQKNRALEGKYKSL